MIMKSKHTGKVSNEVTCYKGAVPMVWLVKEQKIMHHLVALISFIRYYAWIKHDLKLIIAF